MQHEINILGNTIFYEINAQRTVEFDLCFHSQKCWKYRKEFSSKFAYVKNNWLLKNIPKDAKFDK